MHPVYLACAFRRHYRCTIGEYVRQLRVESACRELSKANTPLSQIALTAGFTDQSQFSRTFKRVIGLTPTRIPKNTSAYLNRRQNLSRQTRLNSGGVLSVGVQEELESMCASILWRTRFGLALTLLLLLLSQIAVAQTSTKAMKPPPPPGKLVDVGGWRLHLNCTGSNKGNRPTVVLESGAGDFSFDWSLVQPAVSRFTRVCSYDRAGNAWSDLGPRPRYNETDRL